MTCGRCAANVDHCVRPWYGAEDEHAAVHYPPSKFERFLAISRDGEASVWGIREGEEVSNYLFCDYLVTDDYCEAKAFAAVLAVNAI